jgi:hypothetical protein
MQKKVIVRDWSVVAGWLAGRTDHPVLELREGNGVPLRSNDNLP